MNTLLRERISFYGVARGIVKNESARQSIKPLSQKEGYNEGTPAGVMIKMENKPDINDSAAATFPRAMHDDPLIGEVFMVRQLVFQYFQVNAIMAQRTGYRFELGRPHNLHACAPPPRAHGRSEERNAYCVDSVCYHDSHNIICRI